MVDLIFQLQGATEKIKSEIKGFGMDVKRNDFLGVVRGPVLRYGAHKTFCQRHFLRVCVCARITINKL